jgi:hypothetical protein
MLQNPNYLSAKVLKACYYPKTDVLKSEVGGTPSQVWRGIHKGVQVLKQGLIEKIGSADPFNDQWIPRDGLLWPMACLGEEPPSQIADFIDGAMQPGMKKS